MMETSFEVKNIKKEPSDLISSDGQKIPTRMEMDLAKEESNYLIHNALDIKIEDKDDEYELPLFESTSYEMYPNYDVGIETGEPMIKIKCEGLLNEIMEDPLDVSSHIKGSVGGNEEHLSFSKLGDETNKPSDSEQKEKFSLRNDEEPDSSKHQGANNNKQLPLAHTRKKSLSCNICKKLFIQKSHLDVHMLIHSGEKPHVCDICKKSFNQKCTLNNHMLIHTGVKPFSCSVCNKSFRKQNDLSRHERIHTDEKPHICELCSKQFTQKPHLIEHRRLHTGEKSYSCDICNKSFAQNSGLRQHKRKYKH